MVDEGTLPGLLCSMLPEQLAPRLTRVIALEVNLARARGSLSGPTAEARFDDFIRELTEQHRLVEFLRTYPVIARQLVTVVDDWVSFATDLLGHLVEDWPSIVEAFLDCDRHPGVLTSIDAGLGDSHRGGRGVIALTFDSGLRLAYKPRNLDLDARFQELLDWVNTIAGPPDLYRTRILSCGDHGWCEWIPHKSCTSSSEVEDFYERQGAYLALLYALGATDFHCENVVAFGAHPVLVDLESLFDPRLATDEAGAFEDPASEVLERSVMKVGLLPDWIGEERNARGVDVSGLGGQAGQLSPTPIGRWHEPATDRMRMVEERLGLEGASNRPLLAGHEVELLPFRRNFRAGFERVYRALATHRQTLIEGILPEFRSDETRVIVRSTKAYSELVRTSFHPDLAADALDRDLYLSCLWAVAPGLPHLARLAPAELADVRHGDIPFFKTLAGSRTLWNSHGGEIGGVIDRSGIEQSVDRLSALSEADLAHQLWLVESSFATLELGSGRATWPGSRLGAAVEMPSADQLIAEARRIGERLGALAHWRGRTAGWIGLTPAGGEGWSLAPCDHGLYAGLSGIALFLGYLGAATGDGHFEELARGAVETMRRQFADFRRWPARPDPGAFTGVGGGIYALTHLGSLWQDPILIDEAVELGASRACAGGARREPGFPRRRGGLHRSAARASRSTTNAAQSSLGGGLRRHRASARDHRGRRPRMARPRRGKQTTGRSRTRGRRDRVRPLQACRCIGGRTVQGGGTGRNRVRALTVPAAWPLA